MKRIFSFLFWTLVFIGICLGVDQLLVRVEMPLPVLGEVRAFHVDFRARLLQLGHKKPAEMRPSREARSLGEPRTDAKRLKDEPVAAPPRTAKAQAMAAVSTKSDPSSSRYLYVGPQGELCFADSLEEVPSAHRKDAQRIER